MSYYPNLRMRRMRSQDFSRRLMRESTLSCDDLIYPLFVVEGKQQRQAIEAMPGIERLSVDLLLDEAAAAFDLGIPAIALFPAVGPECKSKDAHHALDENGLVQRAVQTIKAQLPELGVMTDVALDPYTLDGQDGLTDNNGYVMNDETVEVLCQQALSHAQAGADMVAPSDMMDGRIGAIREILEQTGHPNTKILAYTAKYASHFYSPFRDAIGSQANLAKGDKRTYQMDPANALEAITEARLDMEEGADILMVKPATLYLDILYRIKETFGVPVFAYHVSGEYAMLKSAIAAGQLDEKACVMETLLCIKRAGANAIMTYYAKTVAEWLQQPQKIQ